jgi:hypothetical protein
MGGNQMSEAALAAIAPMNTKAGISFSDPTGSADHSQTETGLMGPFPAWYAQAPHRRGARP